MEWPRDISARTKPGLAKQPTPENQPPPFWQRLARLVARGFLLTLLAIFLLITSLRWIDPPTSSVILQHQWHITQHGGKPVEHQWVDWDEMSPELGIAVIASEDQRFPLHHGIDFTELRKAISAGGQRGASTITQQVVKNMFLWQGRSYLRKAIEAVLAVYIDLAWGKQRVLEIYLNIAFFGDNFYGVDAASKSFFNKKADAINRFEAARLAAVLPNPKRFSARNASPYIIERQNWILQQMRKLGGKKYLEKL